MDCAPLNLAHFHERRADRFLRHHRYDEAYKAVETSLLYLQDAYKMVNIFKSFEVLNTLKWDFERKLCQIQMRKQQHEKLKLKEIVPLSEANSLLLPRHEVIAQNVTAQLIARSIDKTIANFDAKFNKSLQEQLEEQQQQQQQQQQVTHQQQPQQQQQLFNSRNQIRLDLNKENIQKQQQQSNTGTTNTTTTTEDEKLAINFEKLKNINIQGNNDKQRQHNKRRQRAVSLTMTKPSDDFCAQLENVIDTDDNDELPSLVPLELPTFDFNVFTTSAPSLAYILSNDNNNMHSESTNQQQL